MTTHGEVRPAPQPAAPGGAASRHLRGRASLGTETVSESPHIPGQAQGSCKHPGCWTHTLQAGSRPERDFRATENNSMKAPLHTVTFLKVKSREAVQQPYAPRGGRRAAGPAAAGQHQHGRLRTRSPRAGRPASFEHRTPCGPTGAEHVERVVLKVALESGLPSAARTDGAFQHAIRNPTQRGSLLPGSPGRGAGHPKAQRGRPFLQVQNQERTKPTCPSASPEALRGQYPLNIFPPSQCGYPYGSGSGSPGSC